MKETTHIMIWAVAVMSMFIFALSRKMMTTWYQELMWGIIVCVVIVMGSFFSSGAHKRVVKVKK